MSSTRKPLSEKNDNSQTENYPLTSTESFIVNNNRPGSSLSLSEYSYSSHKIRYSHTSSSAHSKLGCATSLYDKTPSPFEKENSNFATPEQLANVRAIFNPFEKCIDTLHLPVVSPSLFKDVVSPSEKEDDEFQWSIEQMSVLHPVDIDTPYRQVEYPRDKNYEKKAQDAIDKFFTSTNIMASPWTESTHKFPPVNLVSELFSTESFKGKSSMLKIPKRHSSNGDSGIIPKCKNAWSQTVLTLPPTLPQELEDALAPFCTFDQDQQEQNVEEADDSLNLNNTTLRRRLLFGSEDLLNASSSMKCSSGESNLLLLKAPSPSPASSTASLPLDEEIPIGGSMIRSSSRLSKRNSNSLSPPKLLDDVYDLNSKKVLHAPSPYRSSPDSESNRYQFKVSPITYLPPFGQRMMPSPASANGTGEFCNKTSPILSPIGQYPFIAGQSKPNSCSPHCGHLAGPSTLINCFYHESPSSKCVSELGICLSPSCIVTPMSKFTTPPSVSLKKSHTPFSLHNETPNSLKSQSLSSISFNSHSYRLVNSRNEQTRKSNLKFKHRKTRNSLNKSNRFDLIPSSSNKENEDDSRSKENISTYSSMENSDISNSENSSTFSSKEDNSSSSCDIKDRNIEDILVSSSTQPAQCITTMTKLHKERNKNNPYSSSHLYNDESILKKCNFFNPNHGQGLMDRDGLKVVIANFPFNPALSNNSDKKHGIDAPNVGKILRNNFETHGSPQFSSSPIRPNAPPQPNSFMPELTEGTSRIWSPSQKFSDSPPVSPIGWRVDDHGSYADITDDTTYTSR